MMTDEQYMKMALQEAQNAFDEGEIPVGAIIVCQGRVLSKAHNLTERLHDFTAHAEMLAFTPHRSIWGTSTSISVRFMLP